MTSKDNAGRQAALRQRERAAGIVRVLVRIPKERKAELQQIAKQWREDRRRGSVACETCGGTGIAPDQQ